MPPQPVRGVRSLLCPSCGGTVELRGHGQTLNAVCVQCLSILSTEDASLKVLQHAQGKERVRPAIPLGTRGTLHGTAYEAIGFQVRAIHVDGVAYSWREYLLFNPYKGYRYLTEFDGHWNDVKIVHSLPTETTHRGRRAVAFLGETYRHFQSATARTTFVLGEFPYQVRVGDAVKVDDFVHPPRMLSSETAEGEVTWSVGEYMSGAEVWRHFALPGSPPPVRGVFANQPCPHPGSRSAWLVCAVLLLLLLAVSVAANQGRDRRQVFAGSYSFAADALGERSFVTDVFELRGRPSGVQVRIETDLHQNWAYFLLSLINDDTGHAYNQGREISYYFGRDSDGNWTEGSPGGSVTFRAVPPGRYYLRVEPDMEERGAGVAPPGRMEYSLSVRGGNSTWWPFWLAIPLLAVPPLLLWMSGRSFEFRRWQESDYAVSSGSDE